ncbi:MAG: META domain-containing protein [Bacteroidetes bacterium]|nr:META domain-containing protein [Bacteroidota bacterium]
MPTKPFARIALALLLPVLLLMACQTPDKAAKLAAYVGAYTGTVPCADCEGIQYRIQLGEDGRFVFTAVYLGKASEPFRSEGEYTMDEEGRIVLNPGMDDQQFFEPDADGMWWLDREGKRIEGNLAGHYRLSRMKGGVHSGASARDADRAVNHLSGNEDEPAEGGDLYLRKWKEGIRFYAMGTEPFWALDWKKSGGWIFQTADGEVINLGETEPVYLADSGLTRYSFQTKRYVVRVALKDEPCTDGMSGAPFDLTVALTIQPAGSTAGESARGGIRSYTGCGSFTADPRLHNIWGLIKLEGNVVNPSDYPRGGPVLELNLSTRKVYGTDGCNRFSGSLSVGPAFDYPGLRFGPLASTLMACPGELALYRLGNVLSGMEVSCAWNNQGNLVLSQGVKPLAEFRPID